MSAWFWANVIVAIHVAYVSFVVIGALLVLAGWICRWQWVRNPWFRNIHLLMIAIVVVEGALGITCPLTTWELALRDAAGWGRYDGDFIARCLRGILFYDVDQWILTVGHFVFGALVAFLYVAVPPRLGVHANFLP